MIYVRNQHNIVTVLQLKINVKKALKKSLKITNEEAVKGLTLMVRSWPPS